jgi:hypothetical protein
VRYRQRAAGMKLLGERLSRTPAVRGWYRILPAQEGAMKQLCDDLRQFAIQVHQLGYSLGGGVGERECLYLSERMLAAVKQAETRMAADQLTRRGPNAIP